VGPVTGQRLVGHGFATVGTLAQADLSEVVGLVGRAHGSGLLAHARGVDTRPVTPERDVRSVSAEETFATDLTDRALLEHHLRRLAARVAQRLRRDDLSGRTVTIKVRRFDFSTLHRSATSERPVVAVPEIAGPAVALLRRVDVADGVRLLGIGVCGLSEYAQQDLLAGLDPPGDPEAAPGAADHGAGDRCAGRRGDGLSPAGTPDWRPGQDVLHRELGPGWVQGAGAGVVTVRFEGPRTAVGRVRSFRADDPSLAPGDPPVW
jgi:DNA polymerase-4